MNRHDSRRYMSHRIARSAALVAILSSIMGLSACSQPYTYADGSGKSDGGSQTAGPSDADHDGESGIGSGSDAESSDGTQTARDACQAMIDDVTKEFEELRNEVNDADIDTDLLLAQDPDLEVQWELATENLTKPELSCEGSTDAMKRTVKSAQKLERKYKSKHAEVKELIDQAKTKLASTTDPSTLPTDDSLESRITQAKAVMKATAESGTCPVTFREILADDLAKAQDLINSGTATEEDQRQMAEKLHGATQNAREYRCVPSD